MAITPSFLFDLESEMRVINVDAYAGFSKNLWHSRVMKVAPAGQSRRSMLAWLLSTAQIKDSGLGGNIEFDSIVSQYTEYTHNRASSGLKIHQDQLSDADGGGLDIAHKWASDIGKYMAYWPQKQAIGLIKGGESGKGYDGQNFFSTAHPVDGKSSSVTFSNLISSVPIDASVTTDVALANLGNVFAAIRSVKMPNGEDPRFLRPLTIMGCPKLQPRIQQLTGAKFIAQAAASGGGAADVEAVISNFGLNQPIIADELGGFEETNYYVLCEEVAGDTVGGLVYMEREPFKITYYTGSGGGTGVDAVLDRSLELEWHVQGRNVAGYGHPYMIFKCKAGA